MGTNDDFLLPEPTAAEMMEAAKNNETPASARVSEKWS
jgi:hypothetical protein